MWDPISPAYSIRKKLLIIPVFPKQMFLSQFLIKPNQRGFNVKDNG